MSQKLLTFARSFINGEISAEDFADPYQMLWKAEGENGDSLKDNYQDSEKCSTIFCLADQFILPAETLSRNRSSCLATLRRKGPKNSCSAS